MLALCVSSCSVSSRTVTRESRDRVATYEARDSFTAERVVVMDTVKEVTTITVDRNENGDTIRSRPEGGQSGKTTLHTTLKWVFWIILALIGLIIVLRIRT